MKITFSILTYNSADTIVDCINAILSTKIGQENEIWVIDNGSRDDSVKVVEENFPSVKIIRNPTNDFFSAHNKVLANALGEYFFILNPDILLNDAALSQIAQVITSSSDIVAIGPAHVLNDGTIERTARRRSRPIDCLWLGTFLQIFSPSLRKSHYNYITAPSSTSPNSDTIIDVDVLQDSCILIRSAALKEIGGYDKRFKLYYTEDDLCSRLKKLGRLVYLPKAQIRHFLSTSVRKEKPYTIRKIMFDDMLTYLKLHYGYLTYLIFLPLTYGSLWGWVIAKKIGIGKGKFSIRG